VAVAVVCGLLLGGADASAAPPPTLEVQTIGVGIVTASGINCGATRLLCGTAYGSSVDVSLKATPGTGWTFSRWDDTGTGCDGTNTNPCTALTAISGDNHATAVFTTTKSVQSATLTTSVSDDSGTPEGTVTDPSADSPISCGAPPATGTCSTQVVAGSTLTVQQAPASGSYFFDQWAGSCSGNHDWCSVYLSSSKSVTADYSTSGTATLQIKVDGGGTVSGAGLTCNAGSTCTAQEPSNGKFTLTASANSGYAFTGWSDGCAGDQPTCTVDMGSADSTTGELDVTATFVQVVPILLTVSGAGTVSGASMTCGPGPATCDGSAAPDSTIEFTATPATAGGSVSWVGCTTASGTICTVEVGSDPVSVTANFAGGTTGGGGGSGSFVQLTVTVTGNGYVTSTSTTGPSIYCTAAGGAGCIAQVQQNTSISLRAVAASGATTDFHGWNGSCTGLSTICSLLMTGAKSTSAAFAGTSTTYNLTAAITGSGSVSGAGLKCSFTGSSGCTSPQAADAHVSITATPNAGATFTGWGGACSGSSSTCTVVMSAAENVTATFQANAPASDTLTLNVTGGGTVTAGTKKCTSTPKKPAICSQTVTDGTTIALKATPARGYGFTGWTGACTGTKPTCNIVVNNSVSATAVFHALPIAAGAKKPKVSKLHTGYRVTFSIIIGEKGRLTVTSKPKAAHLAKTVKVGANIVRVTVKKRGRYVFTLSLRSKSGTHRLRYAVKV
jgi:uncharacterized repeat protein (TIGR02543 family)